MSLKQKVAGFLIERLASKYGGELAGKMTGATDEAIKGLLKGLDRNYQEGDIGPEEIQEARDIATVFARKAANGTDAKGGYINRSPEDIAATDKTIHDIIMGTGSDNPNRDDFGRTKTSLAQTVSNGVRAFGNVWNNRQNRLAAALLASQRTGTPNHDAVYGKSAHDRAVEAYAQRRLMSGENVNIITNAASNTLDRIINNYLADQMNVKQMQLTNHMQGQGRGISGAMAQMMHDSYMNRKNMNNIGDLSSSFSNIPGGLI